MPEIKAEINTQQQAARKTGTAESWWAHVKWLEGREAQEAANSHGKSALRSARGYALEQALTAELKALSENDRAGHLKLAQRAHELLWTSFGNAQVRRNVMARYVQAHPDDIEFYNIFVEGESGQERFSAHDARSAGWLKKLAAAPMAEGFLEAGRWQAQLDEKEYWRAPSRALFCYLRAWQLNPKREPAELRQLYLTLATSKNPASAAAAVAVNEKGKIQMVDYRPDPVCQDVGKGEREKMQGQQFRLSKAGAMSYAATAPAAKEAADSVWQLLFTRKTRISANASGGWAWDESRWMWTPLQWDPARKAWVLHTLEQDRANYQKNIERLREITGQETKSIQEWEAKNAAQAAVKDPFETFLGTMQSLKTPEPLENVVRDLRYKAAELGGLGPWVIHYRKEIPVLEQQIKDWESEKSALK